MVLLSPPEVGKSAQTVRTAERLGIPAIPTGDIFRASVTGTIELSTQAKVCTDKGEYVPGSITNAMMTDRVAQADRENGFLLDGYPHTIVQIGKLDSMLEASDLVLNVIAEITAGTETIVARLLKRAGKRGYANGAEPAVHRRLEICVEPMAPPAGLYTERGLLVQVDGMGKIDVVTSRIMEALASHDITGS